MLHIATLSVMKAIHGPWNRTHVMRCDAYGIERKLARDDEFVEHVIKAMRTMSHDPSKSNLRHSTHTQHTHVIEPTKVLERETCKREGQHHRKPP